MSSSIGERIRARRVELGLTLDELGKMVHSTASTVRKWETGYIQNMKSDKIKTVAEALQVTPEFIMGWEEKQTVHVEQVHTNNGLIGQANAPVSLNGDSAPNTLSKEEAELLRIYKALSVKGRIKLLSTAISLEEEEGSE